jgi:hypothetical protein
LDGADDPRGARELTESGSLPLARPLPRFARPGRAALAALLAVAGLVGAGCLESPPPPVKRMFGDAGFVPPPPTTDAGARDGDETLEGGASDGGPAPDAGAATWAGRWQYVSGSTGNLCDSQLAVIADDGFLDITPAPSGTTLTVVDDGCPFTFDLVGDVATEEPDQSCSAWAIAMVPEWTLTMQADGTLAEKIGGRVVEGGEVCTLSGGGTLVRQ